MSTTCVTINEGWIPCWWGRQSRTLYLSVVPATNLRLSSFCNKISEPERGAIRRRRVLTLTAATTPSTTFTTVRSKTALWYRITNSLVKAGFATLSTISRYSGRSATDCQSFHIWRFYDTNWILRRRNTVAQTLGQEESILFGWPVVLSPTSR